MKIGIITFHFVPNHGAVLQCHALQTYLEKLGHSVFVVNYQPTYHTIRYEKSKNPIQYANWFYKRDRREKPVKRVIGYGRSFMRGMALNLQGTDGKVMECFENYTKKHLHLTKKYTSLKELCKDAPEANLYITGSDQLWNPELLDHALDPAYFLYFGGEKVFRASYAISLGKKQDEAYYREVAGLIKRLDQVSIREECKELNAIVEKELPVCIDPVFLLDAKEYESFEVDCGQKEPYIFVFGFETTKELNDAVKQAADRHGCKVVNGSPHRIRLEIPCEKIRAYGPGEFLSLIKNAKLIVTNSFHATAFSILYQKNFVTVPHSTRGLRMNHLLSGLGLEKNSYGNPAFDPSATTDWERVAEKIKTLRADSVIYLSDCVAKAESKKHNTTPYHDKKQCCGCSACQQACPVHAIEMKMDEEGFLYPVIQEEKCIHCHKCEEICAFHHDQEEKTCQNINEKSEKPKSYAVKHKDFDIRMASRSGGLFTALSDAVLKQDGIIYGCVMEGNETAVIRRASDEKQRDAMRGSKYIQSEMRDAFLLVKQDLDAGKKVLFTGTSCQVAGLLGYLGKEYENLICADIVCHGVPSPLIWARYLRWQEKKRGARVLSAEFRNKKDFGWRKHVETLKFENGKKINSEVFKTLFYGHGILRPCCYECPYKSIYHPGDLTMADCWGIQKAAPDFHDDQGVSLALLGTRKGEELFEMVRGTLEVREIELEKCMQTPLKEPFPEPAFRKTLWDLVFSGDFDTVVRRYGRDPFVKACKKKIKSFLGKN